MSRTVFKILIMISAVWLVVAWNNRFFPYQLAMPEEEIADIEIVQVFPKDGNGQPQDQPKRWQRSKRKTDPVFSKDFAPSDALI